MLGRVEPRGQCQGPFLGRGDHACHVRPDRPDQSRWAEAERVSAVRPEVGGPVAPRQELEDGHELHSAKQQREGTGPAEPEQAPPHSVGPASPEDPSGDAEPSHGGHRHSRRRARHPGQSQQRSIRPERDRDRQEDRDRPRRIPPGILQPDRVARRGDRDEVGRLRVASECLERQDDRQPDEGAPIAEPGPSVGVVEPQGHPGRADQEHDVAVLKQHRRPEGVGHRGDGRPRRRDRPVSHERAHRGEGNRDVRDDVEADRPGIGQHGEDQLAGVEDGRRGIAQQRHAAVLLRHPERQPTGRPFLLHAKVERVIVIPAVPVGKLPPPQEDRAEAGEGQEHRAEDGQGERPGDRSRSHHSSVGSARPRPVPGRNRKGHASRHGPSCKNPTISARSAIRRSRRAETLAWINTDRTR